MIQAFYFIKTKQYRFPLCGSISGMEKNIVSLFSTVSWLQMRWQCSLYAQLLPGLLFFVSVSPRSRGISLSGRDQPLHHSHYLHSLLFCVWQHNYQSRGPVQLKASDCWQRGLEERERGRDETGAQQKCARRGTVPRVSTTVTGERGTSGKVWQDVQDDLDAPETTPGSRH